jgi:hypothetical protein
VKRVRVSGGDVDRFHILLAPVISLPKLAYVRFAKAKETSKNFNHAARIGPHKLRRNNGED